MILFNANAEGASGAFTLSTSEFWDRMCSPAFVRLSPNIGVIENAWYFTETPPEMVPGFLEGATRDTKQALGLKGQSHDEARRDIHRRLVGVRCSP